MRTPSSCHILGVSFTASLNEVAKYSAKLGWELDLFEGSETLVFLVLGDFVILDFDESGVQTIH